MVSDKLQPITGAAIALATVTTPSDFTSQSITECIFNSNGFKLHVVSNERTTAFIGEMENVLVPNVIRAIDGSKEQMLIDAINNRTRERNYYQLYSRLLENEITEEEFDREIDNNSDDYVISTNKVPSEQEFHDAMIFADHIKGLETTGDIETLFSFRSKEFNDYCSKLLNGSL